MSKTIDLTKCGIATIKNIYTEGYVDKSDEALALLNPIKDNLVFNTGSSAVGDPYIDATYVEGNVGKALVADNSPFEYKHIASLRLYGGSGNSFVYLNPGDTIELAVTPEQAMFYLGQKGGYLDVTVKSTGENGANVITEVPDAPADDIVEPYLDRTTGIGDDGDPINFDSEAVTENMLPKQNAEVNDDPGAGDKEEPSNPEDEVTG